MVFNSREIELQEVLALAEQFYNIRGTIQGLPGEVDVNFCLKTEDQEYTLKITRPGTDRTYLDFQCAIIRHLSERGFPLQLPVIIPAKDGSDFVLLENQQFLRLQKWVPGQMLDEVLPRSTGLLKSWGRTCGLFSQYLQGFDHRGAHRFQKWNPSETLHAKKYRPYFQTNEQAEIGDYFWQLFETSVLPKLSQLRKSVNYNDAHEHNLLIHGYLSQPVVTGVIDFGDALYTETVNEIAIACAYACMHLPDPLSAAALLVQGYHEVFPLKDEELSVLFPLITARLMLTVANAAWNKFNEPDNEYLLISEKPAWELLKKFRVINPALAYYRFRDACGLPACTNALVFRKWLEMNAPTITPLVSFTGQKVVTLDLSVGSLALGNNSNFDNIESFRKTIERLLEDEHADLALGGYAEARPFYRSPAFQTVGNEGARWRTVHLGLDIWAPVETTVWAPLDATVYSIRNNEGEGNYGPTIILKHEPEENVIFYSLYGHLNEASLFELQVGQKIKKGDRLAAIGAPPVNGNWPSHLHFQIILDILGQEGDFPGVAYPEETSLWLSICPDPQAFFPVPAEYRSPLAEKEILQIRRQRLGKSLSISYEQPLHMVRGFMQQLYDVHGRRYLDTVNNVPHLGHQHPKVVDVAQRQIAVLNTNTRYLHDAIILFAEELVVTFPPELSVVHFVNSGSEANELALRMVEAYTGQKDMIAVQVGYHGNTNGCIAVSSYKFDGKGGKGAPPTTQVVPIPDTYRGIYREEHSGARYAAHVEEAISNIRSNGRDVGGFICESILSCGGQIVLPENYLADAFRYVRAAGGLCIADEVQVGFGRVGSHFWGFELQSVVPDIVTMGKPMANGHPMGAVVTTRQVADAFANGMEYFNTFGGNPVSCAIGREVLKIVQTDKLQQHASEIGRFLSHGLQELQLKYPLIGDVRGPGLFIGVELVKNQETREPASAEANYLVNRMRERGILMSTDGPYNNVLKIKPPMCFNKMDAIFLLENLDFVLKENFVRIRS